VAVVTAEGTGAAVAVAATLAMALTDSGGNGGGRQRRQKTEPESVAGADNNQPESGSDIPPLNTVSIVHRCHSCHPSPLSNANTNLRPSP